MKKLSGLLAAVLAAALIIGSLSGCGAVGPLLIQLSNEIKENGLNWNEELPSGIIEETSEGAEGSTEETAEEAESESLETASEETTEETSEVIDDTERSALLPEYRHYDPTSFYAECEDLGRLSDSGDSDEINALYTKLYEELLAVSDLDTLARLRMYEDSNNKSFEEESEYTNKILVEMQDRFLSVCKKVLEGKNAEAFADYLNDDILVDSYKNYLEKTDELKTLFEEEKDLSNEYLKISENLDQFTTTYNGKEYNLKELVDDEDLFSSDQDAYISVFTECYKKYNEKAGEIFVKLVKIRDQIAKLSGYDNYNDYADTETYGRDYSASDLEKMKTAARKFGAEYMTYYYFAYQTLPEYKIDTEKLLADGKECLTGISPLLDKSFKYMEENSLYSIGNESERSDGGFTTSFIADHVPFLYIKTDDRPYDLLTLAHESGHFADGYYNENPRPLTETGQYDLFEIHSNTLQLLAGDKFDRVFGDDAGSVNAFNVLSIISNVIDGCMYDDWQREIYENPDMTLDEINALFAKVSKEYGQLEYPGSEYSWVEITHNFESPLYYISYATSAFVALQIWLESREDYGAAVSTWEKFIGASAYDEGYMTIVKDNGLKTFDDSATVYNVLNNAYSYARQMLFGF